MSRRSDAPFERANKPKTLEVTLNASLVLLNMGEDHACFFLREQVNNRLANQNKRIKAEVKEGDLTKSQAAALHKDDRQIRKEERLMASQNGVHITKQEQKNRRR